MIGRGESNGVPNFFSARPPWKNFTTPNRRRSADSARLGLGHRLGPSPASGATYFHRFIRPYRVHRHSIWIDPFSQIVRHSIDKLRSSSSRKNRSPRCADAWRTSPRHLWDHRPSVKLTGYNETIVGAGCIAVVEPKGDVLTGLDVLAQQKVRSPAGKTDRSHHQPHWLEPRGKRNVDLMLRRAWRFPVCLGPNIGLIRARIKSHCRARTGNLQARRQHSGRHFVFLRGSACGCDETDRFPCRGANFCCARTSRPVRTSPFGSNHAMQPAPTMVSLYRLTSRWER